MKNKNTLILSTVLVGAGAYIIYNRNRKKKLEATNVEEIERRQKEQAIQQANALARENAKTKYNSLENPNSFASKVARVQLFLGVAVDGIVGPQTRGALMAKFPQYTNLTSTNIDKVLADIFAYQNLNNRFN